jgi:hypothetical protein
VFHPSRSWNRQSISLRLVDTFVVPFRMVENVPCFFSSKIRENESHEFKEKVHVAASLWDDAHKKYIS